MKEHPQSVILIEKTKVSDLWCIVERGTTPRGFMPGRPVVIAGYQSIDKARGVLRAVKADGVQP